MLHFLSPKLLRSLGNLLIITSIFLSLYIYLPVFNTQLRYHLTDPSSQDQTPVSSDFSIIIPKLNINQPVIANIDPFDSQAYSAALKQGVAHASGSATPSESGNVFLFAHSSDNPLSITRYNTDFYLLPKLRAGDPIYISYLGNLYAYQVTHQQIVKPSETSFIFGDNQPRLTLQTCYPIGTDWRRLLIFASPLPD